MRVDDLTRSMRLIGEGRFPPLSGESLRLLSDSECVGELAMFGHSGVILPL